MAAPGGADQPELAEQIQLLREQNNLLVQQNLQLQQGRPAARVQPPPERRRFLEPPTEADLDEQRLYLIPATLTRGPNSHRLPTDVAGAQGEPHLLNLTSEYIYLHSVEKGKKHDSTVFRILLSLLSYLEVLEFGLSAARAQALAAEALTENLVAAVEAQLRPVAAVEHARYSADHCQPAAARGARVHGALSSLWWRVCCGNGSPSAQQNRVPRRMGRGLETLIAALHQPSHAAYLRRPLFLRLADLTARR
ncbi:hypothetical protein NFJ02_12g09770 [Pycnococcus provasolii]